MKSCNCYIAQIVVDKKDNFKTIVEQYHVLHNVLIYQAKFRFLKKTIHEASGKSNSLPDFLLSWTPYEQNVMSSSQVQGGASNAVPEWTKKQGLPRILTTSRRCLYALLTGQLIRHRLVIIDTQVRTALDSCKNFRNLLTSKRERMLPYYLSDLGSMIMIQIIRKEHTKNSKGLSQPHLCFCLHARVWL